MANIKIVENKVVIAMNVTKTQIENVMRYVPDVDCLKDEDGNVKYKLFLGDESSLSSYGACVEFSGEKPIIWLDIPADKMADRAGYFKDTYGIAYGRLKTLEGQIKSAVAEANRVVSGIAGDITVCGDDCGDSAETRHCSDESCGAETPQYKWNE